MKLKERIADLGAFASSKLFGRVRGGGVYFAGSGPTMPGWSDPFTTCTQDNSLGEPSEVDNHESLINNGDNLLNAMAQQVW